MSDVATLVVALARARQYAADLSKKYAVELTLVAAAKRLANNLEDELRVQALDSFLSTGEKPDHEAVKIKMRHLKTWQPTLLNIRRAEIEAPEAISLPEDAFVLHPELLSLVSEHYPTVLTLDQKVMKSLDKDGRANWAEAEESTQPYVELKSALDEYLFQQELMGAAPQE